MTDNPIPVMPGPVSENLTHADCLDNPRGLGDPQDQCNGAVEYRMPLSATGKSFPRCDGHWSDRLDRQEQINARYPDSPFPPAGFDPGYAGESWNDPDDVY